MKEKLRQHFEFEQKLYELHRDLEQLERVGFNLDYGERESVWEGLIDWEDVAGDQHEQEQDRKILLSTTIGRPDSPRGPSVKR